MFLGWPGNALGFPLTSWPKWLGRGKSESPCLGYCLRPDPGKAEDNGWMVGNGALVRVEGIMNCSKYQSVLAQNVQPSVRKLKRISA
ncbi:hypothetical protein AMECASPLE_033020 [Ameca splendens]|uniref:Uncharacterized protein n=1 Tax=Ameca splendens TaxID=208324 RepID=A0ABV0ZGK8_9TELE